MSYRHPDTGRFISASEWESLQEGSEDEFEDFEDFDDWESFGEEELY